ncbi:response regulator [Niabella yanshanensis]|uniref:histidine kinase n=1 Tax=Niabella yanshanensis TaxID=577386 RepID=A0ABZ0WB20_9BACT|nr:hybrid sensor histidine kinase/response regulator transcription factor [Niabella yanshanensis]WQD38762.1 response regulator [Niabella yanshanensis]
MKSILLIKSLLISALSLVLCHPGFAQQFVFSPFERSADLNEDQIRLVNQIPDGRLIILTESSTNLYNVGSVKNIPLDTVNFLPVNDYTNNHFCYVDDKWVWIKNQRSLSILNIVSEKYEDSPGKLLQELGFSEKPKNLFLDEQKNIWLLSVNDELYCYDRGLKTVSLALPGVKVRRNNDLVNNVTSWGEQVFLIYRSGLVKCYARTDFKELYSININEQRKIASWLSFVVASGKFLYLTTDDSGGGCSLIKLDVQTRRQTALINNHKQRVNGLTFDKRGGLWVAGTEGYWYFEASAVSGQFFSGILLNDGQQVHSGVSNVFCDNQEGTWMSTNKGLYYYNPHRFSFSGFNTSFFQFRGTDDLKVFCFEEQADRLLIGTLNGIYTKDVDKNNESKIRLLVPGLRCHALFRSKSGIVWIGAEDGLYAMRPNGSVTKVLDAYAYSIMEPVPGTLVIGTSNQGLLQFEESSQRVTTLFAHSFLPDIRQVLSWNGYWVGFCNNGLFFIDPSKKVLKYANEDRSRLAADLPPDVRILVCLFADKEGLLWLGTYGGLYAWDPVSARMYRFGTPEGLVNNSIKAVIQDADHSIWVTTSKGISRIEKKRLGADYKFTIHNYNENDGVSKHAFVGRASFLSKTNQLYFGNLDGLNYLKHSIEPDTPKIPVVIFNFKLFGRPVEENMLYDGKVLLNTSLSHTGQITLNHHQNFINIQFSGLNYINPEKTYFRYRLSGVDKQWREELPGKHFGEAVYTNLAPGEYKFSVMASFDGHRWPVTAKELIISIQPPVWATIYAKILYTLLLIGILYWLVKRYNTRQKKIRSQQQAEAIEREKSRFLTNISHDLRTPLTLIITPLRSLIRSISDTEIKENLKRIESNADLLLDTVNQLLEFKKIDESGELLHASYVENLSFLSGVGLNYAQLAAEKQIDFKVNVADTAGVWLDKKKVIRMVMNLLSNAFKFTPDGGSIVLDAFVRGTDELIITVADTGIGIPASEKQAIFDRFYKARNQDEANTGSGIGLYLVKKYAELHDGYVVIDDDEQYSTVFKVALNVGRLEQKANEPASDVKKSILIVEDNNSFLTFLETELAAYYTVFTANNGKKALELAIDKQPDLIITDMMMPEMNGIDLCLSIRKNINISHTPIIMLTARASDEAQYEGYEAGADAYLVKPFDMEMLKLRIRKLMQMFLDRQKLFSTEKDVKSDTITTNALDRDLLDRALNCVNGNLANTEYTVEKFSADMHMDRTGLYRKLMALTGQSPRDFIRTIRLNKAAELLSHPNAIVSQVAEEVGFSSVSYFSKSFQEKFGVSPSQYGQ